MKLQKNIFIICALGSILLFSKWCVFYYNSNYHYWFTLRSFKSFEDNIKLPNVKYVLLWNRPRREPLRNIAKGHEIFIKNNCKVTNCYITSNISYFNNVTAFDVILFHGPETVFKHPRFLPKHRSPNQSYIFVSTESADYYFVPDMRCDRVYNYTWTYKLNSDIYFGYIIIKDNNGKVIGPKVNMTWISTDDMLPINDTIKEKLKQKKFAAAWFVSNCKSLNNRQRLAALIQNELIKYNMSVDIFGKCGYQQCPLDLKDKCLKMLQKEYYFYFAFENSMSDDYVTEKLLNALQNYVVPVVFGGANYKRFMPDGIYLDARNISVAELVYQMVGIINDENRYQSFFKWHNHYSFHSPYESAETNTYCKFCDFINNVEFSEGTLDDFFEWWNPHVIVPA